MTTSPMLTLATSSTWAQVAADGPLPAAVLADPDRAGCAWYVVDAPHAAHPHAA